MRLPNKPNARKQSSDGLCEYEECNNNNNNEERHSKSDDKNNKSKNMGKVVPNKTEKETEVDSWDHSIDKEIKTTEDDEQDKALRQQKEAKMLQTYLGKLNNTGTILPSIHLPFVFKFKSTSSKKTKTKALHEAGGNNNANNDSSFPDKIYSVVLNFSKSKLYEPIESVHIPYLCRAVERNPLNPTKKESLSSSSSSNSLTRIPKRSTSKDKDLSDEGDDAHLFVGFPYSYSLFIKLQPLVPLPASFDVNIIFNDSEGNICQGAIEPLHLLFRDLFLPIPATLSARQTLQLWKQLWKRVTLPSYGFDNVQLYALNWTSSLCV